MDNRGLSLTNDRMISVTPLEDQPGRNPDNLNMILLGVPSVQLAGREVAFRTRKTFALLVFIAVEGGMHPRDELVALFWPESDQSRGRASLRSTLAYLRRALRGSSQKSVQKATEVDYLLIESDHLGFNFEAAFESDWRTIQEAWSIARSPVYVSTSGEMEQRESLISPDALLTQLQTSTSCYRGDFLTGFSLEDAPEFDNWASVQREGFHRQVSLIFDRLSQLQFETGELIGSIETASRWIAIDPLSEIAYRRLMQLHFAADDRSAALKAYEACQAALARELNADPSPETQTLADRIRAADVEALYSASESSLSHPLSSTQEHKTVEFPLVGRSKVHLALVTVYRAVRRGRPQAVFIEGEPGIGKTRLAEEFLGWATAQGACVLRGRAFEAGGQLPYQVVIEALRERIERENAPENLLSPLWLAELSRLLPELHERLPDLPLPQNEESTAQTRLYESVVRLCQALALQEPLVFFIDDLQWVDAATLDLLPYACHRWAHADSSILFLCTLRPDKVEAIQTLQPNVQASDWTITLQRDIPVTSFPLEPLTLADTERLVRSFALSITGEQPTRKDQGKNSHVEASSPMVDSELLEKLSLRLFTETGGHPFFLTEVIKMLFGSHLPSSGVVNEKQLEIQGTGPLDFGKVAGQYLRSGERREIPPDVQEMIRARLIDLSPRAQLACLSAAVLGGGFDFEDLRHLSGFSEDEGLETLDELLKRGMIREQPGAANPPYLLVHDYFREMIYNQATAARRKVLHRRAFEMLEIAGAAPAELARHAYAARLFKRAYELEIASGEEAVRLHAPRNAIQHYTQALEIAGKLSIQPNMELYHARGEAYETIGDFEAAQQDFKSAMEEASTRGDLHSQWRASQELGFLWSSRDYLRAGDYFHQGLDLARKISDPGTLARSLNRLGNWHANIEQPTKSIEHHLEALALFEELNEQSGQADTSDLLGMAYYMAGDMERSLAHYERAVSLFRKLDDLRGLVSSQAMMSMVLRATYTVEVSPIPEARQSIPLAKSAAQTARNIGWRAGESHALLALGQNLFHEGQYEPALKAIEAGMTIATEIKHSLWMTYAHWMMGLIHFDLLSLQEAKKHFEASLTLAGETGSMFWIRISTALLTLVLIHLKDKEQAKSILEKSLDFDAVVVDVIDWGAQTSMQRLLWYVRAELAFACQESDLALELVEKLIYSTTNIAVRPVIRLSKLQGEALIALGRKKEAEAALTTAKDAAILQGERPLLWRIQLSLGHVYESEGKQAEAVAQFSEAQTTISELAENIPEGTLRANFLHNSANFFNGG